MVVNAFVCSRSGCNSWQHPLLLVEQIWQKRVDKHQRTASWKRLESRAGFSGILSEEGSWFLGLSLGIWSAYLLWSQPRALERDGSLSKLRRWPGLRPHSDRGNFHRSDNAWQVYILGTVVSRFCNASALGSTAGKDTFQSFTFTISYLLDQLGRLFWAPLHGRMSRTVTSHYKSSTGCY